MSTTQCKRDGWKVKEHELPRWNYLAGKMDAISGEIEAAGYNREHVCKSPLMTYDEVKEFLVIWWREQEPDVSLIKHTLRCLNVGDNDILFK